MNLVTPKISDEMCYNLDFQSNIISDELSTLLENIQYFKMIFLNGNDVIIT